MLKCKGKQVFRARVLDIQIAAPERYDVLNGYDKTKAMPIE